MRRLRVGRDEEDGSALVLALVFITVVSLLISVTLTFAAISVKYGDELATGRRSLYTADGLIEAAISQVAGAPEACAPTFGDLPSLNGIDPGEQSDVTCGEGPESVTPLARPEQAILALGEDDGEGVLQLGTSPYDVVGDIFSNEDIAAPVTMTATGTIAAVDACTGTTVPTCVPGAPRDGPDFDVDLTGIEPRFVQPCPGTTVSLTAGSYTDAVALTGLTDGGCAVVHFAPGTYYFDFTGGASDTWTISDPTVKVVGGTQLTTDPGRCDPAAPAGVTFVFGGTSKVVMTAGSVELCPTPSASGQQISIFGLEETPPTLFEPTTTPAVTGFVQPEKAFKIGDTDYATADPIPATGATMTVSGFAPPFPADAVINEAKVRVSHRESAGAIVKAALVTAEGATIEPSAALPPCIGLALPFCLHELAFSPNLTLEQLTGASVQFTAEAPTAGPASQLDGIDIQVTYTPPAVPLGGCHTSTYPATPGSCALIKATGGKLVVHGTVFAPTADIEVLVPGTTAPAFGRGVIAESLRLGFTSPQTGPAVALPKTSRPALLALGSGVNGGVTQTPGSGSLTVRGDVFARGMVDANGNGLAVQGDVRAGSCSPGITATGVKDCSVADLGQVDPGYEAPPVQPGTPVRQADCPASGTVAELDPGIYDNADDLSEVTSTTCNVDVVHFTPGVYYFDFGPCATVAVCTWTVGDSGVRVVGGAPKGWSAAAPSVPFPGGCNPSTPGVTFVFRGGSRLDVQAGSVELCAGTPDDPEPIAIFGDPVEEQVVTPTATGAFLPFTSGNGIDGVEAVATVTDTASPAIAIFDAGVSVPAGSIIDSAQLTLAHREQDTNFALNLSSSTPGVTLSPSSLSVCTNPTPCTIPTVKVTGLTAANLASFGFTYEADRTVAGSGDAFLDGARLLVTYAAPSNGWTVLEAATQAKVAIHGIVYAPTAEVDVDQRNISAPIFGREVIARKITIGATAAAGYSGPAASAAIDRGLPSAIAGDTFTALIKGRARIRARVEFVGPDRDVTIRSWAVLP